MKIPKPQMHGLAQSRITKWLISSLINAALGGLAFQIFYIDHKKKIYNDFYAHRTIKGSVSGGDSSFVRRRDFTASVIQDFITRTLLQKLAIKSIFKELHSDILHNENDDK
ncbi:hypothetical protein HUJ04_005185 [Dendroctonus ponderosae]|nr:hypothetical protein HUJ04_005185 [Dendroctonus ponderosae]